MRELTINEVNFIAAAGDFTLMTFNSIIVQKRITAF